MVLREDGGAGGPAVLGDAGMDGLSQRFFPPWMDRGLAGGFGIPAGDWDHPDPLRPLGDLPHAGGPFAAHAGVDLHPDLGGELLVLAVEEVKTLHQFEAKLSRDLYKSLPLFGPCP